MFWLETKWILIFDVFFYSRILLSLNCTIFSKWARKNQFSIGFQFLSFFRFKVFWFFVIFFWCSFIEPVGLKKPVFSSESKGSIFEREVNSTLSLLCQAQAYPVPMIRYLRPWDQFLRLWSEGLDSPCFEAPFCKIFAWLVDINKLKFTHFLASVLLSFSSINRF